jgi:GTP diphosphokinase / guanosine-3',5'-bis(diphosphate) 3'-diphosphatase
MENREAFFKRLDPYFAPSILMNIQLAYTLSKAGHRFQSRKELDPQGVPTRYFEHPRRVTLLVIDEARIMDPVVIIAALLHDGVEDTRDLTPRLIEHCFGVEVASIVLILSKVPEEGYSEKFETCADWRPFAIKLCDRLDNIRSLFKPGLTETFQRKQLTETAVKYFPLFDRMMNMTPPVYRDRLAPLISEMHQLVYEGASDLNMPEVACECVLPSDYVIRMQEELL